MNTQEFEALLASGIYARQLKWDADWDASHPDRVRSSKRQSVKEVNWNFYFTKDKDFIVDDTVIRLVERVGGNEGDGDHAHLVFQVDRADEKSQWFRKDGRYSSYNGVDWEYTKVFEVNPQERTVIVYE